jgi:hypothetical protein
VLFADLVNSTQILGRAGDEAVMISSPQTTYSSQRHRRQRTRNSNGRGDGVLATIFPGADTVRWRIASSKPRNVPSKARIRHSYRHSCRRKCCDVRTVNSACPWRGVCATAPPRRRFHAVSQSSQRASRRVLRQSCDHTQRQREKPPTAVV